MSDLDQFVSLGSYLLSISTHLFASLSSACIDFNVNQLTIPGTIKVLYTIKLGISHQISIQTAVQSELV
jgi:hypothetical protein